MTKRRISAAERRARLGARHHLASGAQASGAQETEAHEAGAHAAGVLDAGAQVADAQVADLPVVAGDLVGLHGTDPASAYVSAAVRTGYLSPAAIERVLYEERTVVRMLGMRRTMFYVPVESMPMIQAACTDAIAVRERARLLKLIAEVRTPDPEAFLAKVEDVTVRALEARGEATATELATDEPLLRTKITLAKGKPYEATQSIASRVLFLLSAEGRVVRGRPLGSWLGSQHRWAPVSTWLPEQRPMNVLDARMELIRRWLASFGPGTIADLKWWTGLNTGDVKKALTRLDPVEVELDDGIGLVLPDDVDPVPKPEPWVALLPGLDPTPMGWHGREFYLSADCRVALFDRNGNIGPSIWADGRIVGGWAQRADGSIAYRFVEKTGEGVRKAVQDKAERLEHWFAGVRVIPRFRTPLEKELAES